MALDRHDPADINERIEALGLDRDRLWVGVGAGFDKRPLTTMRNALPALREAIPGVRLVLAAMGPKMCALAGSGFDGAFLNWMTPEFAAGARESVHAGAEESGREPPPVFGYVRTAVGDDAEERLAKEESFYRDLHDGYRRQFARLGQPERDRRRRRSRRRRGSAGAGPIRRAGRSRRPRPRERDARGDGGCGRSGSACLKRAILIALTAGLTFAAPGGAGSVRLELSGAS